MSSDPLKHALQLAACGLKVLPIRPGEKRPPMSSWQHVATSDGKKAKLWWDGLYRGYGVGIATGLQEDGRFIFALDVDEHDPAVSGHEALAELEDKYGKLPDTVRSLTAAGGLHLLFDSGGVEISNGAAANLPGGLDIRGQNGQIAVAPTPHPVEVCKKCLAGVEHPLVPYEWEHGFAPWEHEIAAAPAWLLELLTHRHEPEAKRDDWIKTMFDGGTPADRFRENWDWIAELTKRGWTHLGGEAWTRPGKDPREGSSAMLKGPDGPLNVFSTDESMASLWEAGTRSADGSCVSLSPLQFAAALDHDGDQLAALRAGGFISDDVEEAPKVEESKPDRRLVLTPASQIKPRRVKWLWDGRLALGTLGLLAGPEGLGKSTIAYWMAARITRGDLEGEYEGQPRSVLVCATEDSWEHAIVPRLMAHGADLDRIYRVEVRLVEDIAMPISLPVDLADVKQAALGVDAALMILDPLVSRLDTELDSHRDADVRRALEPLTSVADLTGMAILGLIHHNKSGSEDPLQLVMASKAFTAVARSVHTVIRDPDDETGNRRLFGTPKNNLGRIDLPTMSFTITGWHYDTEDGEGTTGKLTWGTVVEGTIHDALRRSVDSSEERTALVEATEWLRDYMERFGPRVRATQVNDAARGADIAKTTLKRARHRLGIVIERDNTARPQTWWVLPRTDGGFDVEPSDEISIF